MNRIVSVAAALSCAVDTGRDQPRDVPAAPASWVAEAQAALESKDPVRVRACADAILSAHSQYRADFDVKGWLFDLRNAVRSAPAHDAAARAIAGVISATRKA
jgi:hypothetical protein